uniref:NADH-ubiquinone oxidoreductase chain 5 n=1 Tax=Polycheles baccatus TaxID=288637 RepID=A0A4Y5QJM0_9EUCA|nr:NADH dehydrogenase subunit 5 [Polycheles baccatus]QCX31776.1 NADH dehydrogenase subunit 5 [Polycheles baccatus]
MVWKISMNVSSLIFLGGTALLSFFFCLGSLYLKKVLVIEWEILSLNSCLVEMVLVFDWMSLMFLSFVLLISSMILYYSGEYMSSEKNKSRFMYLVIFFVLSMALLIVSPNMISILLGWDGLGLVSYLLVVYYQNEKSMNAGMLTVLSNRIGDVGILMSIGMMFLLGGWNFFFYQETILEGGHIMVLLGGFVVMAAMTKSAQIPFSAWLPAAMAAPTPVSALVHSSTLVTAGVYLLIRFAVALEGSGAQSFLLIISCLTMFMAGLGANFEYDLKKIIALSTLSQLGVMMGILSLGFFDLAFFHLLTHALFKALLFMCAGVVIHNVKDYQDIRSMGGLVVGMPLTSVCMNLASLALCGFPFLAGFYSKDLILEVVFSSSLNLMSFFFFFLSTGLTVSYSFRLFYYSMSGLFGLGGLTCISDKAEVMTGPMIVLGLGAVSSGAMLSWLIFPDPYMICLGGLMKGMTPFLVVMGAVMGYSVNLISVSEGTMGYYNLKLTEFWGTMWFMPILSTLGVSKLELKMGNYYQVVGDKGWLEKFGGQGGYELGLGYSKYLSVFQGGSMNLVFKSFLVWFVILTLFFF